MPLFQVLILAALNIVPGYFVLKGGLYRMMHILKNEEDVFNYGKNKILFMYAVKIGILPDQELSKNEKMVWSRYWYIHIITGITLSLILLYIEETSLISKMIQWIRFETGTLSGF